MSRADAPLQFVQIEPGIQRHLKIKKLARKLGIDEWDACNHWLSILLFAGEQHIQGLLDDVDYEDVAIEAHWSGNPHEFVKALVDVKLLTLQDAVLCINGWTEMYGEVFYSRQQNAERQKRYRESRKDSVTNGSKSVSTDSRVEESKEKKSNRVAVTTESENQNSKPKDPDV